MYLLRRPISASDRNPERFYVTSIEFLSLSRRRSNMGPGSAVGEKDKKLGEIRKLLAGKRKW